MAPKIDALRQLKQKREVTTSKLARFSGFVLDISQSQTVDVLQLKIRLRKAEELWDEFDRIQTEIELLVTDDSESSQRTLFEKTYFGIISQATGILQEQQKTNEGVSQKNKETGTRPQQGMEQVKLPTLQLPSFSGNYEEWLPFQELFKALIHDNKSLTSIQKFHYLKTSLRGEAAQSIQSLQLTEANYEVAWALLKERFENERIIVQSHVKALFSLPKMDSESASSLRKLHDAARKHIRALEALKQPTNSWDTLLVHLISTKFDTTTFRAWEEEVTGSKPPDMKQLNDFLQHRCQMLEAVAAGRTRQRSSHNRETVTVASVVTSGSGHCELCKGSHPLYQCEDFLHRPVSERIAEVKNMKLCINCLRHGHAVKSCKGGSCKKCNRKHNTLLHLSHGDSSVSAQSQPRVATSVSQHTPNTIENTTAAKTYSESTSLQLSANANTFHPFTSVNTGSYIGLGPDTTKGVVLSTARVLVYDRHQRPVECRALLDSGAQSHFITAACAHRLCLPRRSQLMQINGIGAASATSTEVVQTRVKSRLNSTSFNLTFAVLPNITATLPVAPVDISQWVIPESVQLADPGFNQPAEIDLLLGAELFFELLQPGKFCPPSGYPILQNTSFGWVVSGRVDMTAHGRTKPQHETRSSISMLVTLHDQLEKFWELEDCNPEPLHCTDDERLCEEHFIKNTTRMADGRYIVHLPFKNNPAQLGQSENIAVRRFLNLEKRLEAKPDVKEAYRKFMKEYLDLGHMLPVEPIEANASKPTYYLPHHAVFKDTSTTTKLRVVFDGSAKTTTGVSLNETLLVGPKTQDDMFDIIIRFRQHQYVLTADIEKMYRQIKVHPDHTNVQRIVWRDHPSQPLQHFALQTVTYGTACAPYLATSCLKQLSNDEGTSFPMAAEVVKHDFYVDDLLTGRDSLNEAQILRDELIALLQRGCFHLRKWCSNHPLLLEHPEIDVSACELLNREQFIRTLGLIWNPSRDCFQFSIETPKARVTSKRSMLSALARVFDPLGLLSPIIIRWKLIIQDLWKERLDWDDDAPGDLLNQWTTSLSDLECIQQVRISRKVIPSTYTALELHGFADASLRAYGACVYVRALCPTDNQSHLLCSKSRVSPLKQTSIPRLELCAALLLAKLVSRVMAAMTCQFSAVVLWSDSTIVLAWLHSSPHRWTTFVANRCAKIHALTQNCEWKYVRSRDNPADLITRGVDSARLPDLLQWWYGPSWLSEDSVVINEPEQFDESMHLPEEKPMTSVIVGVQVVPTLPLERYSSWTRLNRVVAYVLRFGYNLRHPSAKRSQALTVDELSRATTVIIKQVQQDAFAVEIQSLATDGTVSDRSPLKSLSPFLDSEGVIRVGGRIVNADLPYQSIHQIVLPKHHIVTRLIANHHHIKHGHAGPQLLLTTIRQQYWPIAGRQLANSTVRKCLTCFKQRPVPAKQLMGNLPPARVQPARPFVNTGVDFCGPIHIRFSRRRGASTVKAYIAVFICFSTKAIHLELVGDMSTDAFLAALQRFMARRGKCANIYSDNGTNFVGAARQLSEIQAILQSEVIGGKIQQQLDQDLIKWHFIPPRAPEFGGLWESAVKLTKYHLKRMLGETRLTFEEAYTVLTKIEACLNSRPLTALSSDPNDLEPLTPGHFLIGQPLTAIVEPGLQSVSLHRLSRFQLLQRIQQDFWSRWSREYLTSLQQRTKNFKTVPNVQEGDLIVVKEDHVPPQQWILGRVSKLHPGTDGLVRVVTVNSSKGVIRRPITKICPLPTVA